MGDIQGVPHLVKNVTLNTVGRFGMSPKLCGLTDVSGPLPLCRRCAADSRPNPLFPGIQLPRGEG